MTQNHWSGKRIAGSPKRELPAHQSVSDISLPASCIFPLSRCYKSFWPISANFSAKWLFAEAIGKLTYVFVAYPLFLFNLLHFKSVYFPARKTFFLVIWIGKIGSHETLSLQLLKNINNCYRWNDIWFVFFDLTDFYYLLFFVSVLFINSKCWFRNKWCFVWILRHFPAISGQWSSAAREKRRNAFFK